MPGCRHLPQHPPPPGQSPVTPRDTVRNGAAAFSGDHPVPQLAPQELSLGSLRSRRREGIRCVRHSLGGHLLRVKGREPAEAGRAVRETGKAAGPGRRVLGCRGQNSSAKLVGSPCPSSPSPVSPARCRTRPGLVPAPLARYWLGAAWETALRVRVGAGPEYQQLPPSVTHTPHSGRSERCVFLATQPPPGPPC